MWESLLSIEAVRDLLIASEGEGVCCPVVRHLIAACMIQTNANMQEASLDSIFEALYEFSDACFLFIFIDY